MLRVRVLVVRLHLDLDLGHGAGHPSAHGHGWGRRAGDLQMQGDAGEWQGPVMTRTQPNTQREGTGSVEGGWEGGKGGHEGLPPRG